jgi:predicted homoserine dehydrogenase-like protein
VGWQADVVATAKSDLPAAQVLDGEGGYTVRGTVLPVERSAAIGAFPLGLAQGARLKRAVREGALLTWADVAVGVTRAFELRPELEVDYARRSETGSDTRPF